MKNTYKIFTLIISFLFVFSCSDLEEDRGGILSLDNLQSEGDLVAALTPVYKELQQTFKNPHFMRTNTFGSDDITTWWGGNKAPLRVFDGFLLLVFGSLKSTLCHRIFILLSLAIQAGSKAQLAMNTPNSKARR